jgi:ABC-type bacteriocin/lantibiotic exporter with double-glycine peptidase domain
MIEEIINKIEKKGYKADEELALNIYNELRNSLRRIENSIIALLTIFTSLLILFKMLEIKLELAMIFISFLWLYAIGSYYYYFKRRKFLKEANKCDN